MDFFSLALTHTPVRTDASGSSCPSAAGCDVSAGEPPVVRGAGRCRGGQRLAACLTNATCWHDCLPPARTVRLPARRCTSCSLSCRNMTTFFAGPPGHSQVLTMLLLLPLLAAAATLPDTSSNVPRPKFDSCYGCICEAASRCNPRVGCSKGVCGLFQITQPYWMDAGKPTVPGTPTNNDTAAFERCTTNTFCALETAQLYMARYGKDCNGDGEVGCYDFAMIHYLGPSCEGKVGQEYIEEFENCRFNLLLLNQP